MKLRSKILIAGAVSSSVLIGGAAFAYFTSTGTGTGSATVGNGAALQLVQTTGLTDLVPGGSGNFSIEVTNPANGGIQRLSAIGVTIGTIVPVPANDVPGEPCTALDFAPISPTITPVDLNPGQSITYTGGVSMVNRNADQGSCRGATINLILTANPVV